MRDYGVVRVRFWEWAKRKQLSTEERELALYLLTSPHGNSLGCFRLPMAYLCEDLGKGSETVSETLSKLSQTGFLVRDNASGWTWIVGFLEHNPIPNRNVGKAIEKQLDAVPGDVPFYGKMIEALRAIARTDDKGISTTFLATMEERFRNRLDTVARESKTHTQTQTHEHTHTHDHDHSEAKASGAGAPRQVVDLRKEIFDAGIGILIAAGKRERNARSIIGKWRKDYGDEATLAAIRQAQKNGPSEPVGYITGYLKTWHPSDGAAMSAAQIEADAEEALAGVDYR
jgi:hypothetical protein